MTKVLFIGWDAADWKVINPLLDAGRMPNLQRLVERGAMGRVATLQPALSPMLWTSIATGKRPFKHGIHGFSEPTPDGRGVRPITNFSRRSKAIWNILNQNGLRSIVVGWWPSHPAEPIDGVMVSDHYHRAHRLLVDGNIGSWPLLANSVYPAHLHDTLAELRMHPQELAGPMLVPFLPALEKIDQQEDRRFSMLCKTIAECVSIHSAATWLIEHEPWDFFAVYYDAIDHFCHGFMQYHPPRQPWVSERDFELYSHVVSTAYELHDQMLGTLLAKAGPDVHVMLMSDHGFHSDHLRPRAIPDIPAGPAIEHSPLGIFALSGPGIKGDASLYGVSVLDAAPTLLALYGLPLADDMDGRVIREAFNAPPQLESIPSWEEVPGEDGRHPPHTQLDPVAAAEALEQLVALGYIEKPGDDMAEYVNGTVRELRYNLLESYQDAGQHPDALEIARDLCRRDPDELRFAVKRFLSCQALGLVSEMREIVDDLTGRRRRLFDEAAELMDAFRETVKQRLEAAGHTDAKQIAREIAYELNPQTLPDEPRKPILDSNERHEMRRWRNLLRYQPALVDYLHAQALTAEKRWPEALDALQRVRAVHMARPALLLHAADLYRRLNRQDDARKTYQAALQIDPDNAQAHCGLARLALCQRDYLASAEHARRCLARLYFFPMAHFLLGVARIKLGDSEGAVAALRTALSQNPHFPQAHVWLGRLLRSRLNDPVTAAEHFRFYHAMRDHRTHHHPPSVVASPSSGEKETAYSAPLALGPLGEEALVVSGLPRSGTSMLMQMLAAGGMSVLTDHQRSPDEDNPRGYFELEAVKKLHTDATWVSEARGKAVKVVAPLVCRLPPGTKYRVVFIERDYGEILDSQGKMILRRGETVHDSPQRRQRLTREYDRIVNGAKRVLTARGDVRLLTLRYEDVLDNPMAASHEISVFAGVRLEEARMAEAVEPALHRNRTSEHVT